MTRLTDIEITPQIREQLQGLTDEQIRGVLLSQQREEKAKRENAADVEIDAMAQIVEALGWQAFREFWAKTHPDMAFTPADMEILAEKVLKRRQAQYVGLLSTILSAPESSSSENAMAKNDRIREMQQTLED